MDREIADSIRKIVGISEPQNMLAKVISVDESKYLAEVEPVNGMANFIDVRIQAIQEGNNGVFIVPEVNSIVMINVINNELAVIGQTSEVKELKYINGIEIIANNKGLFVGSSSSDLKSDLEALISNVEALHDAISKLTVTCSAPGSPSTPPINVAEFVANKAKLIPIKQNLKSYLQ